MSNPPVSMQRAPSGVLSLPYNSQGQANNAQGMQAQYKPPFPTQPSQGQYGAPPVAQQYGAPPPQQYGSYGPPAGAPPAQFNPATQFSMAAPAPVPSPYASQPTPQTSYNNTRPPYASAPPAYGAPPPQQYGAQQPYGNPPLQQFPLQQPNIPTGAAGFVGSVSLQKGGNMSLSKANPNLVKVRIGLGWDVRQTGGPAFDLDASAFLLKADGRVRMSQDLIFYNNKQSVDGSVYHHGDNLTGAGDGDDEVVSIDLTRVPPEIQKIVFTCSIYEAELRQQNFGMVSRAFIRVVDDFTNQEICRFDLSEEASLFNTMIFGEVYRYQTEWKFRAVGQGIQGGLKAIGGMFGLNLQ